MTSKTYTFYYKLHRSADKYTGDMQTFCRNLPIVFKEAKNYQNEIEIVYDDIIQAGAIALFEEVLKTNNNTHWYQSVKLAMLNEFNRHPLRDRQNQRKKYEKSENSLDLEQESR